MKHILFLLLLSLAVPAFAQRAVPGASAQPSVQRFYVCHETVSQQQHLADSLLQALDKSQIPTQILYDRVAALAALDVFNRVYNDPDTSGVHHFLQAYYELHMADYNNDGVDPCRQVLADNARYYWERGTVLLGALRYRFNYIDSNAVRNNQLRWDTSAPSQLFDVPGRSGSPYLLREVAIAAALADSSKTGTVNFQLDPASIFTNTGVALSSANIDFGDGNPARSCVPGQTVTVSYAKAGRKVLRYVLTYADGSQFTTYSGLYVAQAAVYNRGANFVDPCRLTPLTASIPYLGIAGQAQVSYYYSTNPLKSCGNGATPNVTKPVVLVDGIDYDGTREGGDMYGEY